MPLINGQYTSISSIPLVEQSSTPATPASGKSTVFAKDDGLYVVNDAGTVTGPMAASAGPAYDASGWTAAGETWTYASADAPTFTFTVASDVTTKYSVGMRIKYTQTTVKYGIITAVSAYSAPNTTITVYGGTDYAMTSGVITLPYYSTVKAPFGFSLNPLKWSIEITDSSDYDQTNPTATNWYNPGSLSISLPIGSWRLSYNCLSRVYAGSNYVDIASTLSTTNDSESDADFTTRSFIFAAVGLSGLLNFGTTCTKDKLLNVSSKTSYYLNISTIATNMMIITIRGTGSKTIIRAVCAYL